MRSKSGNDTLRFALWFGYGIILGAMDNKDILFWMIVALLIVYLIKEW